MSTPVRAQDREHFSIVQNSLARDGLHVAMVARDRRRLQDYAAALARTLAGHAGLRVEAYDPSRLESVVVDLMLHRFDAALSDISATGQYLGHAHGLRAQASRPGCVLFIPEAHALSRAEFRQLLRIAAGTHRNGLRLVALFDADSPVCDERIAEMGTQVARWDLDDDAASDMPRASRPWFRGHDRDTASSDFAGLAPVSRASLPSHTSWLSSGSSLPRIAGMKRLTRGIASNGGRWLAAAGVAAMLAVLPAMRPASDGGSMLSRIEQRTVTRSGIVELAGEPRQTFVRAAAADDERGTALDGQRHGRLDADITDRTDGTGMQTGDDGNAQPAAFTEASSR